MRDMARGDTTGSRHDPVDPAAASRRAGMFWGSLVVGLLGIQVVVGVGAVIVATGDPSVSVVPDYYDKALRWDDEKRSRADSEALGWRADISVPGGADRNGDRTVVVRLRDGEGTAIDGAAVILSLYHHARASELQELKLRGHGDGHYSGTARMPLGGLWQFELRSLRPTVDGDSSERHRLSRTIDVGASPRPTFAPDNGAPSE